MSSQNIHCDRNGETVVLFILEGIEAGTIRKYLKRSKILELLSAFNLENGGLRNDRQLTENCKKTWQRRAEFTKKRVLFIFTFFFVARFFSFSQEILTMKFYSNRDSGRLATYIDEAAWTVTLEAITISGSKKKSSTTIWVH
jgi:hypothetical protein